MSDVFYVWSLLTLHRCSCLIEVFNCGTMRLIWFLLICCSGRLQSVRSTNCPLFVFHFCPLPCVFLLSPSINSLSRMCVSECPSGFFRDDRKRCKKCSSLCETCVGSRSDQCTTCRTGFHLNEGSNTCVANCADGFYLDHGTFHCWLSWLYNVQTLK